MTAYWSSLVGSQKQQDLTAVELQKIPNQHPSNAGTLSTAIGFSIPLIIFPEFRVWNSELSRPLTFASLPIVTR